MWLSGCSFLLVLFVSSLHFDALKGDDGQPIVDTLSGQIRGFQSVSSGGQNYFAFRAIPYAKPPVGPNRFQPPEPVEPWTDVLDATHMGVECPQFEELTRGVVGSEDCLILNVYTPTLEKGAKLPVMFWIHGGGFVVGTGLHSHYGPQRWMDHSVVLVTINYRLGVFGFLNTNDANAHGNYGMLDQVMALKWIKSNIGRFGGDPDSVIIFGESAGSASVTYHLLSPLSRGLFHGAICQSGTAINHWAFQRGPMQVALMLADRINCRSNETAEMVECMRRASVYDLVRESRRLQVSPLCPLFWAPSVESEGGPGFLTRDPNSLLEEGLIANRVPLIMGLTKSEGYLFYLDLKSGERLAGLRVGGANYLKEEFAKHLQMFTFVQPHMTSAVNEIVDQYFAGVRTDDEEELEGAFSQLMSDAMFNAGISKTVQLLTRAGLPIHTYVFNYYANEHCLPELYGKRCGKYCTHCDELFLQFPFVYAQLAPLSQSDSHMSQTINRLWTDFARLRGEGGDLYVKDEEEWPKYADEQKYLELSLSPTIKQGLLSNNTELWTRILPRMAAQHVHTEL